MLVEKNIETLLHAPWRDINAIRHCCHFRIIDVILPGKIRLRKCRYHMTIMPGRYCVWRIWRLPGSI